jgi:hypothetical protein
MKYDLFFFENVPKENKCKLTRWQKLAQSVGQPETSGTNVGAL